ncbi:nuclear transport factor 2 family protein [Thalassotalea euphylliae]|uniref:nuclear transport factor 2 family protein n=1 Tax=Thalassotalea euphylliae TaxID=1655234 RepID=UPI003631E8C6
MRSLPLIIGLLVLTHFTVLANDSSNSQQAIERAVLDYIESQQHVKPQLMARGLDDKLAKRTYWLDKEGNEFIMETSRDFMVELAGNYNVKGDKFPKEPRIEIQILDIDQRVASVKLTVDDWIDYMHLYQNQSGQWKIINVLWQYHDTKLQQSK